MWVVSIPATVQEDFVTSWGWESLVAEMPEQDGMRDAWNAVEFAAPKGSGKHCAMRLHPALAPLLVHMLELRWADHMYRMHEELEPAYARVLDDLKKRTAADAKNRRKR